MGFIVNRLRDLRKNMTPEERKLWQLLRAYRKSGFAFRRQYLVAKRDIAGVCYYFVADFACLGIKLIVEIDGPVHNFHKEADLQRQQIIESYGFKIIRFSNDEINNKIIQVCREIESHLPGFK